MLTQQDFATMLLRGRVTLANTLKAILLKENKDCEPGTWGKVACLGLKLAGLSFSLLIGDYISLDAVASYYGVSELISGEYGVPTTDPNAQAPSNTVVIDNPALPQKPAADEVQYSDDNWDATHTIYSKPEWVGFIPRLYDNGNKFLQLGVDYTVLPTGGFTLAQPIYDGIIYYVIF